MICPVCKQRWAQLDEKKTPLRNLKDSEREKVFHNNEILCCGSPDCLQVIDAMLRAFLDGSSNMGYDDLVEETKKELAEGKIR